MLGPRVGLHRIKASSTTNVQYSGVISVANGSSLRQATVKKIDFKSITPSLGWKIIVAGGTGTISNVTTSGANYVITYTGGNAFTGGLGNPYVVYRG
jgi:hypothetical protein